MWRAEGTSSAELNLHLALDVSPIRCLGFIGMLREARMTIFEGDGLPVGDGLNVRDPVLIQPRLRWVPCIVSALSTDPSLFRTLGSKAVSTHWAPFDDAVLDLLTFVNIL